MKILALSDIHGQFTAFAPDTLPEADIALVAGDFTNLGLGYPPEVALAERWMAQMAKRYPQVHYVMGNHDLGLPDSYFEREGLAIYNIARKVVTVGDYRFIGADLSPCFDWPDLARQWERMTSDPDVDSAYFDSLEAAEVVVSHCPPFGHLDEYGKRGSGRHLGSPALLRYIERVQPTLVLCGHIHEGKGEARHGNTRILNVARHYRVVEID